MFCLLFFLWKNHNYMPCVEKTVSKTHDVKEAFHKIHPVFSNDTLIRYRKRPSDSSYNSNKEIRKRRKKRLCPCCPMKSQSLGNSRASLDEVQLRPNKVCFFFIHTSTILKRQLWLWLTRFIATKEM